MKICFFDLETRKKPEELAPGNAGWDALKQGKGGISALAIYDTSDNWCHIYDDHTMDDIASHLEAADLVVGFNSEGFDIPVVEGLLGRKLILKKHIDVSLCVREAHLAINHPLRKGENTLGAISERLFGEKKLEDGKFAPDLAREGKWGRLMNYCCHDVKLTRDLYYHIEKEGGILSVGGTFIPVPLTAPRVPQEDE